MHRRGLLTANGAIQLGRRYFWNQRTKQGTYPADACLGVNDLGQSPGARELLSWAGMNHSFAGAAEDVPDYLGLRVCAETLRRVTLRAGREVAAARNSGQVSAAFRAEQAVIGPEEGGATRLYASLDGVLVRVRTQAEQDRRRDGTLRKRGELQRQGRELRPLPELRPGHTEGFKEMKVGAFYDQSRQHLHTFVTHQGPAEAGKLLAAHAAHIGFARAQQRGGLMDGAPWIRTQLTGNLPRLHVLLLDFYHLSEHLYGAARCCLGEGEEATAWAKARQQEFKEGRVAETLGAMEALGRAARGPRKKDEVRKLLQYAHDRLDMLGYREALAGGWDIGSGPMESQCKTHTRRVDFSGARWLAIHCTEMMSLAALDVSGQWRPYWRALAA